MARVGPAGGGRRGPAGLLRPGPAALPPPAANGALPGGGGGRLLRPHPRAPPARPAAAGGRRPPPPPPPLTGLFPAVAVSVFGAIPLALLVLGGRAQAGGYDFRPVIAACLAVTLGYAVRLGQVLLRQR